MFDYIIPIILMVLVARTGRFLACTGSMRPAYWEKTWRCDSVTEGGGPICARLRGHWGWHRTRPSGAIGWYEEWEGDGEEVFIVGFGPRHKRERYQGRGV